MHHDRDAPHSHALLAAPENLDVVGVCRAVRQQMSAAMSMPESCKTATSRRRQHKAHAAYS